jgi:phycoerythrin-associated linker protein
MTLANAAYLGIERYANNRVNENWMSASSDDKAAVIRAVYQQVLGNQYVMTSERLEGPESLFKRGYLSVREFVRQVAKSGLYRKRFFESSNPYRFIELNFKHLLGRAPQNKAEMLHHFTILQEQGYDAEIDSYLDSAEYQDRFGEEGVPYLHGWNYSVGQQGLQFSYMLQLARGAAASVKGDILKNQSRLNPAVHAEQPMPVVAPGSKAAGFRKVASDGVTRQGVGSGEEGRTFRVEITGFNNFRLHKRSNRVRFIPFNKLLEYQQQIHREGGRVASVTPVN